MALTRKNARPPATRDAVPSRSVFDRLFDEPFTLTPWWESVATPLQAVQAIPLDIVEEDDVLKVRAPLPGMRAEDIRVEVRDDVLHIQGETREEHEHDDADYHLRENRSGRLERRVVLPFPVRSEDAAAEFADGVLTLTLPKAAEARGRVIEVHAKGAPR